MVSLPAGNGIREAVADHASTLHAIAYSANFAKSAIHFYPDGARLGKSG